MVHVLSIENSSPLEAARLNLITRDIPAEMKAQAAKFRRWQDAQAYLLSKLLLLEGLKKYGINKDVLHHMQYTRFNRPYLPLDIDFNISHSGSSIVCAISNQYQVGVDVEAIHSIDINDFKNQFSEAEFEGIQGADDKLSEFYRLWTMKEAVVKADGRGLNISLQHLLVNQQAVVDGKIWYIHKLDLGNHCMAHLAMDTVWDEKIAIENISLTECLSDVA